METAIIVQIISSVCILIGTIISIVATNNKLKTELEIRQKYQEQQMEEMKQDIKTHNNYAVEIPVIKTELEYIKNMVGEYKK